MKAIKVKAKKAKPLSQREAALIEALGGLLLVVYKGQPKKLAVLIAGLEA